MKFSNTKYSLLLVALFIGLILPSHSFAATPSVDSSNMDIGTRIHTLQTRIHDQLPKLAIASHATASEWNPDIHSLRTPSKAARTSLQAARPLLYQLNKMHARASAIHPPNQTTDLSDPSNPINAYAPYAFIAGRSATDLGLVYSGGLTPGWQDAARFCPQCYDPYYFSRGSDNSLTVANALNYGSDSVNYALNLMNSINGGTFNQFVGQVSTPYSWYAPTFENQYYGSTSNSSFDIAPSTLAVLGYDQSSPYNFTSQFLMNMNSYLYQPWSNSYQWFGSLAAASSEQDAIYEIQKRYKTIADQQLTHFYQNSDLSELRIESNSILMAPLYADPEYLYWSYMLDYVLTNVYENYCATYPTYLDQANIMAAWQPTSDPTELDQRAYTRLYFLYLQGQVEAEAQGIIATNPQLEQWIADVQTYLDYLTSTNWNSSDVEQWFQGWQQDWFKAYETGSQPLENSIEQLMSDYPALQEYQQLNREVIQLSSLFADTQPVQELTGLVNSTLSSSSTAQAVSDAYDTYRTQLESALNGTQFTAVNESYQEQLDSLVANDSFYVDMKTVEYLIVLVVQQFQYEIAAAVDQCYTNYGSNCDSYTDHGVQAVMANVKLDELLQTLGTFYELNTLFWYTFYTGTPRGDYGLSGYPQVEEQAANQVEQVITQITPEVTAAQSAFNTNVNNLAEIKQVKSKTDDLLKNLRGKGATQQRSDSLMDQRLELDQKLNRMSQLATQLREGNSETPKRIYLPLIKR